MTVYQRNRTFHLRRRVPRRYRTVEEREIVAVSLHTDSLSVAKQKAAAAWEHLIEGWEARLHGDNEDARIRFEKARELAAVRGFRYLNALEVARLPDKELIARLQAVMKRDGNPDRIEAVALLGGEKEPSLTVQQALKQFWNLAHDRTIGKSEDQLRRWKNPRIKAIGNFIKLIGNKELAEITADDMLDFRQWWLDRIVADGLTANSANKDITYVINILKTVNTMKRLGLNLPLSDLTIKEGEKRTRPPFSVAWIREKLLAPGALAGLNTQARCILLGMINTGYRPSEGAGLLAEHIRLDCDVPHISIEPVGRQLKSASSKRIIPLVGVSLEAFRECPQGFPDYRFKDRISDTVNKYLRENALLETPSHTLYGLRHSFEDRLLSAGIDERIRRDLFGHSLTRERYGEGASLDHKRKLLVSIAI